MVNFLLTVVVPVYFNEENIPLTWPALRQTLQGLPPHIEWEVVFVDDGSGDASYSHLVTVHKTDPDRVRVVKLTRNFGQVPAIMAGLQEAKGDCAVVFSADLQDPPELILQMVERWRAGERKIVLAVRSGREAGGFGALASRVFYRLMRKFAVPNMPEGGFDIFLIDRRIIDVINHVDEKNTFLQGLVLWTGYTPDTIPYTRRRREVGRSQWTVPGKIKYFVDGFVTYSLFPIRFISFVGLVMSLLSFVYALVILAAKLFWSIPIIGWAPTMVSILMLSGIQLVMLGIMGEYLWRNYRETRRLPSYVVESVLSSRSIEHAAVGSDRPSPPVSVTKPRTLIWGASGHARVVAFILRAEGVYELAGFVDDVSPEREGEAFEGCRVHAGQDAVERLLAEGVTHAVVAVGHNESRVRLADDIQRRGFSLARVVHPASVVAGDVVIGQGTVIAAGCVVHPGTRLGDNVIVNTGSVIDHDCEIGDGVHVAPGSVLAGHVRVGRLSWIGAGSVVKDRIHIGERVTVGAGSVVIRPVPDGVTVYGVPARIP